MEFYVSKRYYWIGWYTQLELSDEKIVKPVVILTYLLDILNNSPTPTATKIRQQNFQI